MKDAKKSQADIRYDGQWGIVDTYDNTFGRDSISKLLTEKEIKAVEAYYYVDHKSTDIYKHRREIELSDPSLVKLAKQAVLR